MTDGEDKGHAHGTAASCPDCGGTMTMICAEARHPETGEPVFLMVADAAGMRLMAEQMLRLAQGDDGDAWEIRPAEKTAGRFPVFLMSSDPGSVMAPAPRAERRAEAARGRRSH